MKPYRSEDLVSLLRSEDGNRRMLALHLLCEGYADQSDILRAVFDGWDQWGAAESFPEFPMLSFLPIQAELVESCCQRAARMSEKRPLTAASTRCGGKLIEHLMRLPASDLQPYVSLIEGTTEVSKIFFRVDLEGLAHRIGLLDQQPDHLAELLNQAVSALVSDHNNASAVHQGLHAVEALRRQHPEYMDLMAVLERGPRDEGPQAVSFQLTLQSLVQFKHPESESYLGPHLHDSREAVVSSVVEALVRLGTIGAAEELCQRFPSANPDNQKWIARGLQRIRVAGLAPKIAEARAAAADPSLNVMMMIAEVRQFDASHIQRVTGELEEFAEYSETLIDSVLMFVHLSQGADHERELTKACMSYLERANDKLQREIQEKQRRTLQADRSRRKRDAAKTLERFRKKR